MAMGRANGNGTLYKGDQTFLLQFQLKIIDETQKQNYPSNVIFWSNFG